MCYSLVELTPCPIICHCYVCHAKQVTAVALSVVMLTVAAKGVYSTVRGFLSILQIALSKVGELHLAIRIQ
jgi:hypothetical protein